MPQRLLITIISCVLSRWAPRTRIHALRVHARPGLVRYPGRFERWFILIHTGELSGLTDAWIRLKKNGAWSHGTRARAIVYHPGGLINNNNRDATAGTYVYACLRFVFVTASTS